MLLRLSWSVVLLTRKVIGPVNEIENKEATWETNPWNDMNLFCRKFIISDPSWQPIGWESRGQNRSWGYELSSFYSSK